MKLKDYSPNKISHEFTNLDFIRQYYPKAKIEVDDIYQIDDEWQIEHIESEFFCVNNTYFDRDVGYVTDPDIFSGNVAECLEYIMKQTNEEYF